jgi:hypothetical protein
VRYSFSSHTWPTRGSHRHAVIRLTKETARPNHLVSDPQLHRRNLISARPPGDYPAAQGTSRPRSRSLSSPAECRRLRRPPSAAAGICRSPQASPCRIHTSPAWHLDVNHQLLIVRCPASAHITPHFFTRRSGISACQKSCLPPGFTAGNELDKPPGACSQ